MGTDSKLVEVVRGGLVESVHRGHAVICDGAGEVVEAWGDSEAVIFPRSSCKMIQALPLLESGAGRDLTTRHLALSCASHRGQSIHTDLAESWLRDMGMGDDDLRCGAHMPYSEEAQADLIRAGEGPCQVHNNCSGKHCGFLMVNRRIGGDPDYVEMDHPVQRGVRTTFEEVTGTEVRAMGIDGCSAPTPATPIAAFAGAMGRFARAREGGDRRADAMARLRGAMALHPELVAGPGRACTELMRAAGKGAAVKTGAEAVYVAILPELDRGIAVKITDGTTRASEAVIAALLARVGAINPQAPIVRSLTEGPIRNVRGLVTGQMTVTLG